MKVKFEQVDKIINIDIKKLKTLTEEEIEVKLKKLILFSFCEGGDSGGAYGDIIINGKTLDQNDLFKEIKKEK
jgi:hypothetical protein